MGALLKTPGLEYLTTEAARGEGLDFLEADGPASLAGSIATMKTIVRRIHKLEDRFAVMYAMRNPPAPEGPSAGQVLEQRLSRMGVVRAANESVIEMTARAFGMRTIELRAELERRAAGISVGR